MLEAKVDGELIQAGPDSPEVALCPACGGEVRKRKRKVGRHGHTFFYRHRHRSSARSDDCPLRYKPTR
jgi:predicted nucleic acid-binding Zn ribbon protein